MLNKSLTKLGFTPIPYEIYTFKRDNVIIFYVDDVVIAFSKLILLESTWGNRIVKVERYKFIGGYNL
jgi:hypothetical protein